MCRTCCERCQHDSDCVCTDAERAIEGIYTFLELAEATRSGYRTEWLYEMYCYGEERSNLGFAEFIDNLLRLKIIYSEIPKEYSGREWCDIWNERRPGWNLRPEDIRPDPGMRFSIKILLNGTRDERSRRDRLRPASGIWGKMTENPQRLTTSTVTTFTELKRILDDRRLEIVECVRAGDRALMVSYRTMEALVTEGDTYNPVLAGERERDARDRSLYYSARDGGGPFAPVEGTATNRKQRRDDSLYGYIKKARNRRGIFVYFQDTDSVMAVLPPGMEGPSRIADVGEFQSELAEDERAIAFQCLAPKTYRLETTRGTTTKTKGLSLNMGNVREALGDNRTMWSRLLRERLERGGGRRGDAPGEAFYEALRGVPEGLKTAAREHYLANAEAGAASELVLAQPSLKRDRFSCTIEDRPATVRTVGVRFEKRRLLKIGCDPLSGGPCSVPWGYREGGSSSSSSSS